MDSELALFSSEIIDCDGIDPVEELKKSNLPCILYGAGSMSYSVKKILDANGISINAILLDNPTYSYIDNVEVLSLSDICKKYPLFNIVFGHSRYELSEKLMLIKNVANCFCLLNVCYGNWNHLSSSFVKANIREYYSSYVLFEDKLSRESFKAYLNSKIAEDWKYLIPVSKERVSYFCNPFFKISASETYVDAGAYNGDSIDDFLSVTDSFCSIFAFEPEKESYEILEKKVNNLNNRDIHIYNYGLFDRDTSLFFSEDKESSSIISRSNKSIIVKKLDDVIKGAQVSLIKINYLHGVSETLFGAQEILKTQKPKLAIMVGFDEYQIIRIPQIIKSINPSYKLSLRFASAMPSRLVLFAY